MDLVTHGIFPTRKILEPHATFVQKNTQSGNFKTRQNKLSKNKMAPRTLPLQVHSNRDQLYSFQYLQTHYQIPTFFFFSPQKRTVSQNSQLTLNTPSAPSSRGTRTPLCNLPIRHRHFLLRIPYFQPHIKFAYSQSGVDGCFPSVSSGWSCFLRVLRSTADFEACSLFQPVNQQTQVKATSPHSEFSSWHKKYFSHPLRRACSHLQTSHLQYYIGTENKKEFTYHKSTQVAFSPLLRTAQTPGNTSRTE